MGIRRLILFLLGGLLFVLGILGLLLPGDTLPGMVADLHNFWLMSGSLLLLIAALRTLYLHLSVPHRNIMGTAIRYIILVFFGIFMAYPLLWMLSASFKENSEIFSTLNLIPSRPVLDGYRMAMNDYGGDINIWKAMLNTYKFVLPKVLFTVISSTLTAYGFGRFRFRGRNALFALLIATLFLPQVVLNIPQFLMFKQFGWIDSPYYLAMIVPSMFAQDTYFVYMLIQFLRGVPRELDEAAKIDGCSAMKTLIHVLVPMLWPAMVSAALFQFMWSSNDFMGPLLFVNSPAKYPATLFVRMSMDADTGFSWNRIMAVSLISIAPTLLIFFHAQSQFMDGVAAGAIKA